MTLLKTSPDADAPPPPAASDRRLLRTPRLRRPPWTVAVLALVCYIPLLLTARGRIGADTKAYLYLDPTRLLERAPYMWDEHIGAGTVTHQNIGYLFPMGPWYWLFDHAGVPTWIAERLWTGSLLFLAGLGVRFLLRSFGWSERALFVAALGYALTPYAMQYEARTSAILLPFVGLPWMLGLSVRALRAPRGWRYPALLALIIFTIGGTNATSLVYALIGPLLWLPYAVWVRHEVRLKPALGVLARAGGLTIAVSLWWVIGLRTQSAYGLNVLRYTETVRTVSTSNNPLEILRGLGNWYTYGGDRLGAWVEPAQQYMTNPALLVVSYGVPVLALLAAAFVKWRHRAFFAVLLLAGLVIAVGAHPYASPSPLGRLFRAFAENSTAGLAMRTTPRAAPLVVLGEMVLLAAGVEALRRSLAARSADRRRTAPAGARTGLRTRLAAVPVVAVVALLLANMTPLFQGTLVDKALQAPSEVPDYWQKAIADLEAGSPESPGPSTRVLELPGQDFSYYRWGTTADPLTPGLMDRPFVSRELTPYGTPGSAALIRALDRRLQEGVFEPGSVAPVSRLLGVGDVVLRSDLQYERFRTPRPRRTYAEMTTPGIGLQDPRTYGPPALEKPSVPFTDEVTLGTPPSAAEAPSVAIFGVKDAQPIVRAERAQQPLVLDGDAEGLVDAAAAGVLNGSQPVLFGASLTPEQRQQALGSDADLLVTDSNRDRAERWGSLRENLGYTEGPGEQPLEEDPTDNRLPVFGDAAEGVDTGVTDPSKTQTRLSGIASVRATTYGNPLSYVPADRPAGAIDGDPTTAWRVGAFDDVRDERLRIDLKAPVRTDRITLLQPVTGPRNRYLTRVGLSINGGPEQSVALGDASRTRPGQVVRIPAQDVRSVEITTHDTNVGLKSQYLGDSGVGFAEIGIPGVRGEELVTMPTETLDAAGPSSLNHRLMLQMSRERSDPAEPVKQDGELAMQRAFSLPTQRTLAVTGTARISASIPDDRIDALLGQGPGSGTGLRVTSSEFLPGSLASRGSSAFDNDPRTAWTTPFGQPTGQWVQAASPRPVTVDRMNLRVVADGQHSVPTAVRLSVDGGPPRLIRLPAIRDRVGQDGATRNASTEVPLRFPAVTGRTFRVEVASVRPETTIDFFSRTPQQLPAAFAEVGLPGLSVPPVPAQVTTPCRSDLLTVDGRPVPVRISGTGADAEGRKGLTVSACGAAPTLGPGQHVLRTGEGRTTGIDLDRLVLASDAGGGPSAVTPAGTVAAAPVPPGSRAAVPTVAVEKEGPVSSTVRVTGAEPGKPFWFVFGQSQSDGWRATIDGASLGTSRLVDGFANGWVVTPNRDDFTVELSWTPQRAVWIGLAISAVAVLLCLGLAFWPRRRSRHTPAPALARDDVVTLTGLRERVGRRPLLTSILWVVVLGATSTLLAGPGAGLVVTLVAAGAFFLPYGAAVARVLPALVLAGCALYVLQVQYRYELPADFNWVRNFDRIQPVVWLAPLLLILVLALDRRRGLPTTVSGNAADMSESEQPTESQPTESQQPRTVEPTVGGTAGLPGQHAAPGTNRVSEDELADTVSGEGPQGGSTPADKDTETGSNG